MSITQLIVQSPAGRGSYTRPPSVKRTAPQTSDEHTDDLSITERERKTERVVERERESERAIERGKERKGERVREGEQDFVTCLCIRNTIRQHTHLHV